MQLLELLRLGQKFLVEVEEGLFEDAILLDLRHHWHFFALLYGLFLDNLAATLLLFIEYLHGELAIIVQLFEQVSNLLFAEMWIFLHECSEVVIGELLVVVEGEC